MKFFIVLYLSSVLSSTFAENKVLFFGEHNFPYSTKHPDNSINGIVNILLKNSTLEHTLDITDWKGANDSFYKKPKKSIIFPLVRMKSRDEKYQWIAPIANSETSIYTHSELLSCSPAKVSKIKDIKSLKNALRDKKKFGVLPLTSASSLLSKYGGEENLIIGSSIGEVIDLLKECKVSYIALDSQAVSSHILMNKDLQAKLIRNMILLRAQMWFAADKAMHPKLAKYIQQQILKSWKNENSRKELEKYHHIKSIPKILEHVQKNEK